MRKQYLLSYKLYPLQDIEFTGYELTILNIWFWGLFKTINKQPYFTKQLNLSKVNERFDKMIKQKIIL